MRPCFSLVLSCLAAAQSVEDLPTFKTRVNLVTVPVVVRDKSGRTVGNLEKEDFRLFDRGKLQVISRFSIEKAPGTPTGITPEEAKEKATTSALSVPPERFVAYLFDDVHLAFGDLAFLRDAARRHLNGLQETDRAAIYTTSGQVMQEFTDDRDVLHAALARLVPRPLATRASVDCPNLSYHMANQISNRNDPIALRAATNETRACAHIQDTRAAQSIAAAAARRVVAENEHQTRVSLSVLRDVVQRMGVAPGQRVVVLASPGFITPEMQRDKSEIIDRAIRAGVMINAIDGRGLWVDPTLDASRPGYNPDVLQAKNQYDRESAGMQADVLAEMAAGTGGTFFQNSNDLDAGFRRVAAAPEYSYLLGFSPENLKMDGSFHNLKVAIETRNGLTAHARKGYYAPKTVTNRAEAAKEAIQQALFSREELSDLPVTLKSEFVKRTGRIAQVTVLARVDVKNMRFRKVEGRNCNDLAITIGIFDRNGIHVAGLQKTLEMRMKDDTLAQNAATGLTLRATFDIAPGSYRVRLIARDSEAEQLSALNGALEIP